MLFFTNNSKVKVTRFKMLVLTERSIVPRNNHALALNENLTNHVKNKGSQKSYYM